MMNNRFVQNPTEECIKEIGGSFCLQDAVIVLDTIDVEQIMACSENTVILYGKATGANRCADAIEDAVFHCCTVAKDYNLFTAGKVLLHFDCPKNAPMLMSEIESINTFMEMFGSDTMWKWGFAEKADLKAMKVMLIASNLKEKYQNN